MATFEQLEKHWTRLRKADDETFPGVLKRLLSIGTKQAVMIDLSAAIDTAKDEWQEELEVIIRDAADKLDVDDPLRLAIESVS